MVRRLIAFASVLTLVAATPVAAQGPDVRVPDDVRVEINQSKEPGVYLVRLHAAPVVAYEGETRGLPATKPARGEKINPNSARVRNYAAHLTGRHDAILRSVPGATKIIDYVYSYNGFAAVMTAAQAETLRQQDGVQAVVKDELRQLTTDRTPDFLGLTAEGGLWDDLGGQGAAGEDIIIGVIDTGIWPEHPSFSDQVDLVDRPGRSGRGTLAYGPPPADWHGSCQSGERWSQNDCNNKLIGARYFLAGHTHAGIIGDDFKSARDADGHGTHTASTAGGNADVSAEILGSALGEVSGMAPRARIAAYKACWLSGCAVSDLVAAIDQAVADGVDVINYSIGSTASTLLGQDDIAFLFAELNGVYVATSAGNAGPDASTVGSPASVPWLTSVGASTKDRTFENTVVLGSGAQFVGVSVTGGTVELPLIDSADVTPNAGFNAEDAELCFLGALSASEVSGKIVLCKRGISARVEKSQAVAEAGGAGMVLYNAAATEALVSDNHYVPSSHVSFADGTAIKSYIAAAEPTAVATITPSRAADDQGSVMADFSSRGPDRAAGDLIKPDVTAPGVNILAGNTPAAVLGAPDQLFQAISGTSMSSPHVAGLGALLRQAHPDWTPAMIKSALMTTGRQDVFKEDGATPADPFDMGAGHVVPNSAVDPGLVYNAGLDEYFAFICGATSALPQSFCDDLAADGFSLDASDLNLASIGIAELAGEQTVTRTVTNVGGAGTYEVSVDAPDGVSVDVSPETLTLDAGESATFEVTFTTQSGAVLDEWTFGSLTWSDDSHSVRSPLAITPVALAAPDEQMGTGVEGFLSYEVTFGYEGPFTVDDWGLVPATMTPGNVVDDPANDINVALQTGVGITFHEVDVPVGTEFARFSLFDAYTDGNDDLDLYIFGPCTPGCPFAGGSGSPTSEEEVSIDGPASGTYVAVVHGWQTDGADANYTLFNWNVSATGVGNMTVSSSTAVAALAETATITVAWTDLLADTKYLGAVAYNGGTLEQTVIRIDTD